MSLTPKQTRILQEPATSGWWLTRKSMKAATGRNGFSEALGAATRDLRPNSLEAQGLVRRRTDDAPFEYKITPAGRAALAELGLAPTAKSAMNLTAAQLHGDLEAKVAQALQDSVSARRRRLSAASKKPEKIEVLTVAYSRNADVIARYLFERVDCASPAGRPHLSIGAPMARPILKSITRKRLPTEATTPSRTRLPCAQTVTDERTMPRLHAGTIATSYSLAPNARQFYL